MATKLYLHREGVGTLPSGTLPSGEQSSLAADANLFDNEDGTENRAMDKTISTQAQTTLTNTSTGDTNPHNYYIARWVSPPLAQTSVAANTWTLEFAATESNAAANFPRSSTGALRVCAYVWKPSNGTKYGDILDGNTNADGEEAGTSQTVMNCTFSGAAVSSLTAGDAVIVYEMWAVVTQANTSTRTQTVAYDGTTENSTTNMAARLETPENLAFAYTRSIATETVSSTESTTRVFGATRPISTETVSSTESTVRSVGRQRSPGSGVSVLFDGVNDFVDCGNHSDLWSQGLTKFSFSYWIYPTIINDGSTRDTIRHGTAGHRFISDIDSTVAGRIRFVIRNDIDTGNNIATADTLVAHQWQNITCVYDNSLGSQNVKIYRNAVVGSGTANFTQTVNASAALLLSNNVTDFQGNMRDFRWWTTKALTQAEITSVYNVASDAPTPDYWIKMDEGSGTPIDSILGKTTSFSGAVFSSSSPFEQVNITDSTTRMLAATRNPVETTTISDSVTRLLAANRTLQETVAILDSVVRELGVGSTSYERSPATETVTISDSITRLLEATRNPQETTTSSESITRLLAANRTLSAETNNSTETLARLLAATRSIETETTTSSDAVARVRGVVRAPATETVTSSDSVTRLLAANRTIQIETTTITDAVNRLLAATRSIQTETTNITDSVARTLGVAGINYQRSITETTTISESLVRMLAATRTIEQTTTSSDNVTRLLAATRQMLEQVSSLDSILRLLSANRSIATETTSSSDSVTRLITRVRTIVENIDISDAITRAFVGARPIEEIVEIADAVARTLTPFQIPTRLSKILTWLRANYTEDDPSL